MTCNKFLFVVSSVPETEREKIIENLKKKSCGWDKLKLRIMKFTKYKQSVIPNRGISSWTKIANVVPIFKSGDETRVAGTS